MSQENVEAVRSMYAGFSGHSGLQTQYRVYPGFGPLSARLAMYLI